MSVGQEKGEGTIAFSNIYVRVLALTKGKKKMNFTHRKTFIKYANYPKSRTYSKKVRRCLFSQIPKLEIQERIIYRETFILRE